MNTAVVPYIKQEVVTQIAKSKTKFLLRVLRFTFIIFLMGCLLGCGFFQRKKTTTTVNNCSIKKSDIIEIITVEADSGIITKVSLQQSVGFSPELVDFLVMMSEETVERLNSIPGINASLSANDDMTMAILSLWLDLTLLDFNQVAGQFDLLDLPILEQLDDSLDEELYIKKLIAWGYTCEEIDVEKLLHTMAIKD